MLALVLGSGGCVATPFCEYYTDQCIADGDTWDSTSNDPDIGETLESAGSDDDDSTDADTTRDLDDSSEGMETDGSDGQDELPTAPAMLSLNPTAIKHFDFTWESAVGADSYQLHTKPGDQPDYLQIGQAVAGTSVSILAGLHRSAGSNYRVSACNGVGCVDSAPVDVEVASLTVAIGYLKASNTGPNDVFGGQVALSGDAATLAIAATGEASADGVPSNDLAEGSGAVYIFVRTDLEWSFQAYLKASNSDAGDEFGASLALSTDGSTLVVGAPAEDSNSTTIDGGLGELNNLAEGAGAAYVFTRTGSVWNKQAYIKASNTDADDRFGTSVALSGTGDRLAVGAQGEASASLGVGGNQSDDTADDSGAVYIFDRQAGVWSQSRYIKTQNTDAGDLFGCSVSMSADGGTLVVGAFGEDSQSVDTPSDDTRPSSGAAYVFTFFNNEWAQKQYLKASNIGTGDSFGQAVAVSADGTTLAVGAPGEDGNGQGIDPPADDFVSTAGAVYTFRNTGLVWEDLHYIKPSNPQVGGEFGKSVALASDATVLVVGSPGETGSTTGIDPSQDTSSIAAGAVYVFLGANPAWEVGSYIKAPNTGSGDQFGQSVALSGDGDTLLVGSPGEDSSAIELGGVQASNAASNAGAAYLY